MRRGEFKEESIDLNDLLSNIVKEHEFMLPADSIKFVCDGPRRVMANKLLHDVFSNLIGNAIKHSDGNGVNINIMLENASENGKKYHKVLVEDTGPGVPDDMKDRIFNRLQRGDTKARGLGLGLFIVKTLVESYHGKVWVEDRVQGDHKKGSRFVVLLPVAEDSNGS
jgi:signal transduction histidine kinase